MEVVSKIEEYFEEQLYQIYEQSFEFGSPWTKKQVNESLFQENNHYLFVKEENQLVGFLLYIAIADQADVINLAILPSFQKQGVAKKLVLAMEEELCKRGTSEVFLEVRQSNINAQNFYKKIGFEEISKRKNYYHHPSEDAIILRKRIKYSGEMSALT
jgi:ribosomal-protein-alanine N-acetyltransferase